MSSARNHSHEFVGLSEVLIPNNSRLSSKTQASELGKPARFTPSDLPHEERVGTN